MGEVSKTLEFCTATNAFLMHSQHIRSWLVAGAGRCSQSVFSQPHCIIQARSVTLGADSEELHRLTTPADWDEFTTRRKQLGLLSG